MVLSRKSIWVRYYVFLLRLAGHESWAVQDRLEKISDLCQFARAIILRTAAAAAFAGMVFMLLTAFVVSAFKDPLGFVLCMGIIAGVLSLVWGIIWGIFKIRDRLKDGPPGLVRTYASAVKRGICPMLKIEPR